MDSVQDWTRLQEAADALLVRRALNRSAAVSALCGGLAIVVGAMPPPSPVLVALGVTLAAAALWNASTVTTFGVVTEGVALALSGLYLMSSVVVDSAFGPRSSDGGWFALFGLFLVVWGVLGFVRVPRIRQAGVVSPGSQETKRVAELIARARAASSDRDEDVIEFLTLDIHRYHHKLYLTPVGALALLNGGRQVRFVGKRDVGTARTDPAAAGPRVEATLRVGGQLMNANMTVRDLERLETWRRGWAMPVSHAA